MPGFTTESLALGALTFMRDLPDTALWHLARIAERRTLTEGELLFKAGEPRRALGVVVSGGLSIEQQFGDTTIEIISLGAGDVVSEGVLLEDGPHGSSGRATGPTTLIVFPVEALAKLLKNQPAVHAALLAKAGKVMNGRIRAANATLAGARKGAANARATVEQWLNAIEARAKSLGAERALAEARQALAAGRDAREFGAG